MIMSEVGTDSVSYEAWEGILLCLKGLFPGMISSEGAISTMNLCDYVW